MIEFFETATRDDGTSYVRLVDANETVTGAPDWLRDAVYEAHDGELPNDWRYETCRQIAGLIDEGVDAFDIADSLTDIYTAQLVGWIAERPERLHYVDTARDEGFTATTADIESQIRLGQFYCIEQMAATLIDAQQQNEDE